MKILTLLLFIPIATIAQKNQKEPSEQDIEMAYKGMPKVDGAYEYSEIIQLDTSFTKEVLYRNAKTFFTNTFVSAKDVLQYDDRGEGKVIGKGNFQIEDGQTVMLSYVIMKYIVNFSLEIFSKDGRYRYRLYGLTIDYHSGTGDYGALNRGTFSIDDAYQKTLKGMTKKMDRRLFMSILDHINLTIVGLKKAMAQQPTNDNF